MVEIMFAVYAARIDADDPLSALETGERPDPEPPAGWTTVAVKLGADQAFPTGARLPERVDVVMETVGQATWSHSVRSLRPGGRIVISGATSGDVPPAELTRIFFTQLSVAGSTMGTRDQLGRLLRFCEQTSTRPLIDRVIPLAQAADGFAAMIEGTQTGKIVFTP